MTGTVVYVQSIRMMAGGKHNASCHVWQPFGNLFMRKKSIRRKKGKKEKKSKAEKLNCRNIASCAVC
jgi:hypothetical protein